MRIIDIKGENRGGGVWSSRRCGDGGNPLRAAWTMRPGLAIVSNLSLSLGATLKWSNILSILKVTVTVFLGLGLWFYLNSLSKILICGVDNIVFFILDLCLCLFVSLGSFFIFWASILLFWGCIFIINDLLYFYWLKYYYAEW